LFVPLRFTWRHLALAVQAVTCDSSLSGFVVLYLAFWPIVGLLVCGRTDEVPRTCVSPEADFSSSQLLFEALLFYFPPNTVVVERLLSPASPWVDSSLAQVRPASFFFPGLSPSLFRDFNVRSKLKRRVSRSKGELFPHPLARTLFTFLF